MGKLHELLAVEGDLQGTAKKLSQEAIRTFTKNEHFLGSHRHLEMFDADAQAGVVADEFREMVTTVPEKLEYLGESLAQYWDAVLQKELTNQSANADLVVDGEVLATCLPATFLLGMEARLKEFRQVIESTPTLAPGVAWERDETLGKGVYKMKNADEKLKTAKTFQFKVLYAATDKHPAQIEKWEEQIPVGKYITNITSGMLSPAEKSAMLARVDKLIQAVKKARMQANTADVAEATIGKTLLNYVLG